MKPLWGAIFLALSLNIFVSAYSLPAAAAFGEGVMYVNVSEAPSAGPTIAPTNTKWVIQSGGRVFPVSATRAKYMRVATYHGTQMLSAPQAYPILNALMYSYDPLMSAPQAQPVMNMPAVPRGYPAPNMPAPNYAPSPNAPREYPAPNVPAPNYAPSPNALRGYPAPNAPAPNYAPSPVAPQTDAAPNSSAPNYMSEPGAPMDGPLFDPSRYRYYPPAPESK